MSRVPATLPKGILKYIGQHLRWVEEPFDSSGRLLKDVAYQTGKKGTKAKYVYTTDAAGRLRTAHAHPLVLDKTKRAANARNTPGKLPGDHAGHLFADIFGGSPRLDNLVSQARGVNLSKMKALENKWARGMSATPPSKITVDIEVKYGAGDRPLGFVVHETIDGVKQPPTRFTNK